MNQEEIYLIIGISVGGFISLLTFILLLLKFYIPKKGVNEYKQTISDVEKQLEKDLKFWARKSKITFIPKALLISKKNEPFQVDGMLLTQKALIVLKIVKKDIKAVDENNQKLNPILANDQVIENILPLILSNIPIVSLIIYLNDVEKIDTENIPQHVVLTKHEELFISLKAIDDALEVIESMQKPQKDTIYYNLISQISKNKRVYRQYEKLQNSKVT